MSGSFIHHTSVLTGVAAAALVALVSSAGAYAPSGAGTASLAALSQHSTAVQATVGQQTRHLIARRGGDGGSGHDRGSRDRSGHDRNEHDRNKHV